LALIQDAVSSPMVGKIRMQFWRDAIKQISDVRRRGLY
jgi:NADH dehydrogenase [ubiquinone] 1 alpha subcomplex assembly factor 6